MFKEYSERDLRNTLLKELRSLGLVNPDINKLFAKGYIVLQIDSDMYRNALIDFMAPLGDEYDVEREYWLHIFTHGSHDERREVINQIKAAKQSRTN